MDELPAARGIAVRHGTVRPRTLKLALGLANQPRPLPVASDKWHMDEIVLTTLLSLGRGQWRRRCGATTSTPS